MFFGMILIHLFLMPFCMLDSPKDFRLSVNQLYMASIMGFSMVMLEATMHPMPTYAWILTLLGLLVTFIAVRKQWFIGDDQYLADMIPHHSMAILTSKQIQTKTKSPVVYNLARRIETAQVSEIAEMNTL